MDNVVQLFEPGNYLVRVRTHDLYTFLINANSKDEAMKKAEDSLMVKWMPEEATSSRRIDVASVTVNRIDVSKLTEDDL